ncbi:MAG: hypothetical protein ACM3W8_06520 [Sideroxydans sp.]
MTDTQTGKQAKGMKVSHTQAESGHVSGHPVYVYESAGIEEREGQVPLWLWLVVVSLMIWGLYYLFTYWNAPIGP